MIFVYVDCGAVSIFFHQPARRSLLGQSVNMLAHSPVSPAPLVRLVQCFLVLIYVGWVPRNYAAPYGPFCEQQLLVCAILGSDDRHQRLKLHLRLLHQRAPEKGALGPLQIQAMTRNPQDPQTLHLLVGAHPKIPKSEVRACNSKHDGTN